MYLLLYFLCKGGSKEYIYFTDIEDIQIVNIKVRTWLCSICFQREHVTLKHNINNKALKPYKYENDIHIDTIHELHYLYNIHVLNNWNNCVYAVIYCCMII